MSNPTPPAPPAKKSRRWLFIVLALLLVLGGAGGGGFWWWRKSAAAATHAEAEKPKAKPAPTGIVPLEPFLVNLADTEASRFLRVTLRLVVADEHEAKEIEEDPVRLARVRSSILEFLTTQTSAHLVTPDGKKALKHAIAERSASLLSIEVEDVLFTDFVVQF